LIPSCAYEEFKRISKFLSAIIEKETKIAAISKYFKEKGEETFVEFVNFLIVEGKKGKKNTQGDLLMLVAGFVIDLPACVKERMVNLALEKGHAETATFFSSPDLSIPQSHRDEGVLKGKNGKPLTLGERKSFARNPSRRLLIRLLHDPAPEVIENLLKNPMITEKEVIRIASLRPVKPKILEVLFRSRRWFSSYRVKLALISNPYLLPELGLKIVPLLLRQDLMNLVENKMIHPDIREAIKLRLSEMENTHENEIENTILFEETEIKEEN